MPSLHFTPEEWRRISHQEFDRMMMQRGFDLKRPLRRFETTGGITFTQDLERFDGIFVDEIQKDIPAHHVEYSDLGRLLESITRRRCDDGGAALSAEKKRKRLLALGGICFWAGLVAMFGYIPFELGGWNGVRIGWTLLAASICLRIGSDLIAKNRGKP